LLLGGDGGWQKEEKIAEQKSRMQRAATSTTTMARHKEGNREKYTTDSAYEQYVETMRDC